jgi:uncharacterized protein YaaN involved in tellurite resistance
MTDQTIDTTVTPPADGAAPADDAANGATAAGSDGGLEPLAAPAPVQAISPSQATGMVPLDQATEAKLDDRVKTFLDGVVSLDVHSQAFQDKATAVSNMGDQDIRAAASVSSRFLDRPTKQMEQGPLTRSSEISTSLVQLRRQVEDLDPSKQGALEPHKILGIIPFGDRIRDYFARYESAQTNLNAIINSLYHGQDELRLDNASIETEKQNLWAIMGRLEQYAYLGKQLDAGLTTRIAQIQATDPDKAKILQEDLLFPVRQKVQDLLTQLAVSIQGYLALDLIRRNNVELIKGVDRATTTTVSALRTAVIVAQALGDQKLVLDQITALNTTTSNLIESTSELLRQQSTQINEQASASTIQLDKLTAAFDNIYATMDEIDTFKLKALDSMQQTVTALQTEIDRSKTYTDRVRQGEAAEALADSATSSDGSGGSDGSAGGAGAAAGADGAANAAPELTL